MKISVVIPTYNRKPILAKALRMLFAQQDIAETDWEIVVVDDGSTDGTGEWVQTLTAEAHVPLTYIYQANCGPGTARNQGIRAATAPLILMIGDDILAAPNLLAQHLLAHKNAPDNRVAILGLVEWAPTLTVTPFMRWWHENRFQFEAIRTERIRPDFWCFYTCNISVKRSFLLAHGLFDESFRAAAYEDTELAYRLKEAGLTIHFAPEAKAYHDHPTDLQAAGRQMETIGRWSLLFEEKTHFWSAPPTWIRLGKIPWLRPAIIRPFQIWAERLQTKKEIGPLYATVMLYHFWTGRRKALADQADKHIGEYE